MGMSMSIAKSVQLTAFPQHLHQIGPHPGTVHGLRLLRLNTSLCSRTHRQSLQIVVGHSRFWTNHHLSPASGKWQMSTVSHQLNSRTSKGSSSINNSSFIGTVLHRSSCRQLPHSISNDAVHNSISCDTVLIMNSQVPETTSSSGQVLSR